MFYAYINLHVNALKIDEEIIWTVVITSERVYKQWTMIMHGKAGD